MRSWTLALLLILCGCSTSQVASDCIVVKPWTKVQQQTVLNAVRRANDQTLNEFLEDYARMRIQARQQPCNLTSFPSL